MLLLPCSWLRRSSSPGLVLRAYVNERRRHDDLRALYASMRLAQSEPGMGASLSELLVSTRRLLRADLAWIVLLPREPSDPTLVAECSERGVAELRPAALSAGEDAAVRAALAARGVLMAPAPGLPAFLAERKLRDRAVHRASRPVGGSRRGRRRERRRAVHERGRAPAGDVRR